MNLLKKTTVPLSVADNEAVIVIGTGPVGIKFVQTLLENENTPVIKIFGNEPWEPYNRVKLSSFFAGQVEMDELAIGKNLEDKNLVLHNNCEVISIDPVSRTVTDELGNTHRYSKLIIATGSSPHIPNIKGVNLDNIFTFRNMSDIESLMSRRTRSRKTVVIGGGVLGIEAAKAMTRQNTEVTIIDHSLSLMSNQLDETASEMLRDYILSLGIKVYLGQIIKEFKGDTKVEKILLSDGREIEYDTVILSTGIKPNIDLARKAHLSVGKGIRVNDAMQTSNQDIYAIGECAEHRGKVYGVVKPGLEQAKVAAYSLHGKKENYTGSLSATQIKVIDKQVFSMGDTYEISSVGLRKEYVYRDDTKGIYRKIVIKTHGIVGAIAIGEWDELGRIQESILKKRFVPPWVLLKFKKTGNLWPEEDSKNINEWPAATVICNCTGVTRGQLSSEISNGITTLADIGTSTGASTVCGGCKPLVAQMLSGNVQVDPVKGSRNIFVMGFLTTLITLLAIFLPSIPFANTAEVVWQWDTIWRDSTYKQISGYSLLALSVVALLLSLRKRVKKFSFSSFPVWRIIHVAVGFATVFGLAIHSGYRLGEGINYYLALSFIAVLIAGAASSIVVAVEHKIDLSLSRKLKNKFVWLHILAFWPLPALLAVHIFKSYYF